MNRQRPGEMSLVVVTGLVDHIQDGRSASQEKGGPPGALDLINRPAGQSGNLENAPLFRSRRNTLRFSENCILHGTVGHDQPGPCEPVHECFRIFKIGEIPRRSIQPERPAGGVGRVTLFRSRRSLERISGMKVPGLNRTPNHSPCGGQSAMVALVSGPRTMRVVRPSRRMTTMSQLQAAIEWNTPALSL